MKKNDKIMDKITASRIKNLGLDDPSPDFTSKVMLSIMEQPVYAAKPRNYWWLSAFVPVVIGIAWGTIVIFHLTGYILHFWNALNENVKPFSATLVSWVYQVKHIDFPPLVVIGFIAILTLLTIEELISRTKHI